jgi:hypothetical protein
MTRKVNNRREPKSNALDMDGLSGQSIAEIAKKIRLSDASLIAIDGLPGAGKTTCAARLSALLTIRAVHLDDYLRRDCIGFTEFLRYEDLRRSLWGRPVIVEGVCMLDVLDRLELRPDRFVYIKVPFANQHLDQSHPLIREVSAYTDRLQPAEEADFLFVRSGCGPKECKTRAGKQISIDTYLTKRRSQISLGLTATGMIMLAIGVMFVVVGSSPHRDSLTRVGAEDLSLVGTGLATILMSSLWIFLARSARR